MHFASSRYSGIFCLFFIFSAARYEVTLTPSWPVGFHQGYWDQSLSIPSAIYGKRTHPISRLVFVDFFCSDDSLFIHSDTTYLQVGLPQGFQDFSLSSYPLPCMERGHTLSSRVSGMVFRVAPCPCPLTYEDTPDQQVDGPPIFFGLLCPYPLQYIIRGRTLSARSKFSAFFVIYLRPYPLMYRVRGPTLSTRF